MPRRGTEPCCAAVSLPFEEDNGWPAAAAYFSLARCTSPGLGPRLPTPLRCGEPMGEPLPP
jgi:hypothetical protein